MATFRVVPGHAITTGNGPADAGGWPFASCECGELFVSKDETIVLEAVADHLGDIEGILELDYTIEVWTNLDVHYAECTCGWEMRHLFQHMLETHVKNHIQTHKELGEIVEVV